MPEPIDEIVQNLSPAVSERITEQRIQLGDGTYRVIGRKIERIVRNGGGIRTETIEEKTMDDLGVKINSQDEIGGQCTCGRLVQKEHFQLCRRCGRPQCVRCVSMIDSMPYCSWCNFMVRLRRLFHRR